MYAKAIVIFLGSLGLLAYVLGIVILGVRGLAESSQPAFQPGLDGFLFTSVGSALATIFGAVVGIEVPGPGLFSYVRGRNRKDVEALFKSPTFAEAASIVYVFGLLASAGFWLLDPDKSNVAEAITSQTKTLLGVVVGAIFVAANVKKRE